MNKPVPRSVPSSPRSKIRVLGQFKQARSLEALAEIVQALGNSHEFDLEVVGRGWPQIPGWTVRSEFVGEGELDELITTSEVVVIPYEKFYQSDIAVRCLELGVPVVSGPNKQIEQLYGSDWSGLVQGSWWDAIAKSMGADLAERQASSYEGCLREWASALAAFRTEARDAPLESSKRDMRAR